jgi:hypothetical protein
LPHAFIEAEAAESPSPKESYTGAVRAPGRRQTAEQAQVELLNRRKWRIRVELANAIFEYLEIFHSRHRRHSALGMHTPIEYELLHQTRQPADENPENLVHPTGEDQSFGVGECPAICVGMDRKEIHVIDNPKQVGRVQGSFFCRRGAERAWRASEARQWRRAPG